MNLMLDGQIVFFSYYSKLEIPTYLIYFCVVLGKTVNREVIQ